MHSKCIYIYYIENKYQRKKSQISMFTKGLISDRKIIKKRKKLENFQDKTETINHLYFLQ